MAVSYFGKDEEKYVLNHLRYRKIRDGFLVTTDYGSWAYLTKEEYKKLEKEQLDEPLFSLLKEKGIILNESNVDNMVENQRRKCNYLFNGASLHIVVPTKRCNIKCVYCHAAAENMDKCMFDMDDETAKKTVDFIFQSPAKAIIIEFQGGEPLLRFDLVKYMVKYAKELNKKHKKKLNFSIVTNLILMTDDKLEFLINNSIGICTSLDGHKIVHNKNRQGYDKTAPWIKKILSQYTLNAMLLVTKNSLPYPKEIVDEYVKFELPAIWIKPFNNLGFAQDNLDKIYITVDEYLDFYKKALAHIVKTNREYYLRENYTRVILKKILSKYCYNFADLESPCGAAIAQLVYNYNGSIHTCDEGRLYDIFKIGTINDKYEEVLGSKETQAIIKASLNDNNPVCETCAYKPYCGLCPVCSYAETKNIIPKMPDRRCEILKGMFDHIFEKLLFDEEYKKVFFEWLVDKKGSFI